MSHNDEQYRFEVYIAGIQVPFINVSVGSQFGSLASARIDLPYSPFITRVHEQSKVQVFSQRSYNGILYEPELEFDGIVIGVVRNRNVMGQVTASLSCLTDGYVWNRRKQFDFYLEQIADADYRGTGSSVNMRADGCITNFYSDVMQKNRFDVGCAAASILTSFTSGKSVVEENAEANDDIKHITAYATKHVYIYNGKKFSNVIGTDEEISSSSSLTPEYYAKYLRDHKLANKLYGLSTSKETKQFFKTDNFIKMITNSLNDLQGENTFWSIATQVLNYGFYIIFDIPNPTFIGANSSNSIDSSPEIEVDYPKTEEDKPWDPDKKEEKKEDTNVDEPPLVDLSSHSTPLNKKDADNIVADRAMHGLAEYILKPVSVLGMPLKCNIIWPDQLIAESLFFDYANMPTRVLLQKQAIPGPVDYVMLTTKKIVGLLVDVKDKTHFFSSFNPQYEMRVRENDAYSDYEKEYGISYRSVPLSYAFNSTYLESRIKKDDGAPDITDDNVDTEEADKITDEMNNYVNYNFAQFFFASRNYSIQVTPNTTVVPGLPLIIMDRNGDHVIAFVTGVQKSYNATNGNISVNVTVAYPHYYYENVKTLGNVVDPTTKDPVAAAELALLYGAQPLLPMNSSFTALASKIETLFSNYMEHSHNERYKMRNEYRRRVCTYAEYVKFHSDKSIGKEALYTLPSKLLEDKFKSSHRADTLSNREFRVYDKTTKTYKIYNSKDPQAIETNQANILSNQDIINKHIEWCSQAQNI